MKRQPLPLRELLEGALYYPSSGTDGDPVKYMGTLIQSFVYTDYGASRAPESVVQWLIRIVLKGG